MKWILATRNPGKKREFEVLLGDAVVGLELHSLGSWPTAVPEVEEDRDTFVGNAVKKALEVSRATGVSALADDSGLEVDALDGRPGVYSARFSEEGTDSANNARLVAELRGVAPEDRTARYVAVVALALTGQDYASLFAESFERLPTSDGAAPELGEWCRVGDRAVVAFRGTCEGRIVDEPRGDGGFGYDPHFFVDDWGQRMAEVPLDKKNERSHRARAVRKLAATLRAGETP
jgi:XTP/dITP diphosphohydrolase